MRTLSIALTLLLSLVLPAAAVHAEDQPDLETMIGQMLMVGFRGQSITPEDPIFQDLAEGRVCGVILFDRDLITGSRERNIASPEQLRRLTGQIRAAAGRPIFIAVDMEGGKVQRLKERHGFQAFPSAEELGRGSPAETRAEAARMGRELAEMGLNLDMAPVVDLNLNPDNPVIGKLGRSFGPDPEQVAAQAGAFIQGLAEHGVLACCKHFPGHGSSQADSHLGLTDVTDAWRRSELEPYRLLIARGLTPMIMTAHIFNARLDPERPATLSKAVISGLLRGELGFDGVVVSDDMQMKAVTEAYGLEEAVALAVNAGVDVLLFGNNLVYDPQVASTARDMLTRMVADGRVPRSRVEEASRRVRALLKTKASGVWGE